MNDELKVILNYLDMYKNMDDGLLNSKDKKLLLDYITNLQQELEIMVKDDERSQETINKLSKENERLKQSNKVLEENWEHYMKCCEEAVEYIQNNMQYDDNIDDNWVMTNDLLNILQNGSEE